MENNLSSAALVKNDHTEAKEAQFDLPQSYGKTESFLLPKDPSWMFLFWDIVKDTYDFIMGKHGADIFSKSKSVIRVYDITGVNNFDGGNALSCFDVPVVLDAGSWYLSVPQGGKRYICDIGIITPSGQFILLSRSNSSVMPSGGVSNLVDDKWMMVEGDYQKLLKLSGAEKWGKGGASEKLQHFLSQRWKMFEFETMPSSNVSSWGSHSIASEDYAPTEDEEIWLKADCELIVYGQASKNAFVAIGGKPIALNPDGSFSLRYSLQDGRVVIPIRAQHHTKEEKKRAIIIKAERQKEA
jgi:hypothetical protein